MAEISAKDVAALRKITGAGMMDCKKALEENNGDIELAKDWLREKGIAGAAKRAGRDADQGAIEVTVQGTVGAVVELNCETDFVAKGDVFKEALSKLVAVVIAEGADDLAAKSIDGESVDDFVKGLSGKLGEKIEVGRLVRFESSDGLLDAYKHVQNERGTIGVLVELGGVDASSPEARDVAHEIALHISFAAPAYLTRDEVPDDVLAREREVLEAKSRNEHVPEDKIEGAVKGRLNGFYKEVVLLDQPSVKDPKVSIGKLLEGLGKGATVTRFARVKAGEE